jgi:hypothetical protein
MGHVYYDRGDGLGWNREVQSREGERSVCVCCWRWVIALSWEDI